MNLACDILVAGGGVAGIPAAVAAARAGARVVLVEKEDFLGGAGVMALHRYLCGLYLNGPQEPKETLNSGLTREIVTDIQSFLSANRPVQMGRVWGLPFEPAHLRSVYKTLAEKEPNLTVLYASTVASVDCSGERITAVTIHKQGEPSTFHPAAVIDATGSGEVIRLSGAPFKLAPKPERQLSGCTVHLDGIAGKRELLGIKIAWKLSRLPSVETQGLPLFAGFAEGAAAHDGFCKFSIPATLDALDDDALAQNIICLHALLSSHLPELAHSRIVAQSQRMEREGIRLVGQWELDEASLLTARKFPDGLVRSAWPIEFWEPSDATPHYAYPPDGDYADIPRRCLRSNCITNLFAAGRCISASSRVLAATRVMGTCMALGEAAGNEAASFVKRQQS